MLRINQIECSGNQSIKEFCCGWRKLTQKSFKRVFEKSVEQEESSLSVSCEYTFHSTERATWVKLIPATSRKINFSFSVRWFQSRNLVVVPVKLICGKSLTRFSTFCVRAVAGVRYRVTFPNGRPFIPTSETGASTEHGWEYMTVCVRGCGWMSSENPVHQRLSSTVKPGFLTCEKKSLTWPPWQIIFWYPINLDLGTGAD
jgi:hypothetical protein